MEKQEGQWVMCMECCELDLKCSGPDMECGGNVQCVECQDKLFVTLNKLCRVCKQWHHRGCGHEHPDDELAEHYMSIHGSESAVGGRSEVSHSDVESVVADTALRDLALLLPVPEGAIQVENWREGIIDDKSDAAQSYGDMEEEEEEAEEEEPTPQRTRASKKRKRKQPQKPAAWQQVCWQDAGACVVCNRSGEDADCPCGLCGWPVHRQCAIPERGGNIGSSNRDGDWHLCGAQVCTPVLCRAKHARCASLRKRPYVWTVPAVACAPAAWPCM